MLGKTTRNVHILVINSFSRDDAGKYKCKASDQSGQSDTKTTIITMEGINLLCDRVVVYSQVAVHIISCF